MNRKPRFFVWGLVAFLVLNCQFLKVVMAQSVDPGILGPHAVSQIEYNLGDTAFTPPGFPGPVEVLASVHYPTNLSAGPFPLIVFLHGRHVTCFDGFAFLQWPCPSPNSSIPSYQGYEYIAQILASHGYIVASISANGINAQDNMSSDFGALARAQLIQHHLQLWDAFNATGTAPLGNLFVGAVDLNNVGTMGHSRGGEGIVRHFIFNANQGSPFGIKAVFPLAPTNFSRNVINQVPLAVMLPYCDGDVSDLQGVHFFDDALYNVSGDLSPKQTILVMGANHNFFNTIWTPSIFPQGSSDDWSISADSHCGTALGNQRLTDTQQRGAGLAYIVGFFRRYLGGESKFNSMFTGDTLPPASALTNNIFVTFHAPGDPSLRRDVNRILGAGNLTSNTLGGAVTQSGLVPYDVCGGAAPQPRHCLPFSESTARQPHTVESFLAPTRRGLSQLRIGWNDPAAEIINELPPGSRDVSGFFALQFRVSINFADSSNPTGVTQNFSVSLTDGDGNNANVNIADLSLASRVLFYPPGTTSSVPKVILNGLRIPLSAFIDVNLTDIRSIKFGFDQNPQGALLISDITFVNTAGPVDVYFLVDLSGSFADDLPIFKASAPNIMSTLMGSNPDTRFGVGSFEDYPIPPFGDASSGDVAYRQDIDLTFNTTAVESIINGLTTRFGADEPESQLPALYQAATGNGQDLSGAGFPGASIPPGQQVNFRDDVTKLFLLWTDAPFHRPGDPGSIPYPGPSFTQTVDAILALDPPKVIGISSGGGGMADLEAIATATDAFAPLGGVDCDNDGIIDLFEGDPLVCSIASSGAGISDAIISLVEAAAEPTEIQVTIDIKPGSDPNSINLKSKGIIPVAILSTDTFDATTVDPLSVSFGPNEATEAHGKGHIEDVNADARLDLVFHFRTQETGIACGDLSASLTGETFAGDTIQGSDTIRTVGCK